MQASVYQLRIYHRRHLLLLLGSPSYVSLRTFWEVFKALKSDLELKGVKEVSGVVQHGNICDLNTSHL